MLHSYTASIHRVCRRQLLALRNSGCPRRLSPRQVEFERGPEGQLLPHASAPMNGSSFSVLVFRREGAECSGSSVKSMRPEVCRAFCKFEMVRSKFDVQLHSTCAIFGGLTRRLFHSGTNDLILCHLGIHHLAKICQQNSQQPGRRAVHM